MTAISVGEIKERVRNNVSALTKALDGDLLQRYDEKRIISIDFIRNYGQLSSHCDDPRNPVESRSFEMFKKNVGFEFKQTGRQRDDKQILEFYPIKLINKKGKHQTYKGDQIYLNDVPTIPVTDENDAERRAFTPIHDDYLFVIYPEVTIRGIKELDYMRFPTPSCPPRPNTPQHLSLIHI